MYATSKNTTGTDGSVKKSIDGGTTWTNVTPELEGVRLDGGSWTGVATSSDGSRVFAALEGMGVFVSSTGGTTWTRTMTAPSGAWPAIRASGSGKHVIATKSFAEPADRGVWVSTDFGTTWTRTFSSADATPAAVSRDGLTMAFAVYGGSLYVSRDFGSTWLAESLVDSPWMGIGLSESGERIIAVAEGGLARFATTTTTTTTTTTSTTVAPATTEAPATTAATTTSTTTTSSSTTTTAAPSTTVATTTTSTIVDSPPPAVTPSMVESFKPRPLVKDEQVTAGETVTVRISGFQPFELVTIGFDESGAVKSQAVGDSVRAFTGKKVLLTVRADAMGTISVQAKLPTTVSGAVTLWAYGRESKVGFRQKFDVVELPRTGSEGPGANLMLAGSFVASGVVLFSLRRRLRRTNSAHITR